jgi:alpha-galactosidase/6-phospho-beta-glucosidase family protein
VREVAFDPIVDENVAYVAQFYASSHMAWLRDAVKLAIESGVPIFVTEWSSAEVDRDIDRQETAKWIDFLDEMQISYCKSMKHQHYYYYYNNILL